MGRRKSTVRQPWDVLGLPKSTYFWKLRRGLINGITSEIWMEFVLSFGG